MDGELKIEPPQQQSHDQLNIEELLTVLMKLRKGDFSARMSMIYTGMPGKIADTLNEIIELNEKMADEFERVARVVGKEGKTTYRVAHASSGFWENCANSVNSLIVNLAQPTIEASRVISAVAKGDLTQNMSLEMDGRPLTGDFRRIAMTINTMVDQLSTFASEVTRVAREVGTEGKLGGQAEVTGVAGTWKDLTDNVNMLAANLKNQVRDIATVTTAVATGDLSKQITVDAKGEILELKNTINTMVDQLNTFASEVTRVAREVGTEGKLGGQAEVKGVAGTWKDLTDNVNMMAANLTNQVRNIAEVTTGIATGDLSKKITVDVRGEFLRLKDTINTMVDQLGNFAAEVTRVAREVGTEGKLGGQAYVLGVSGTWKDLTESVNIMARNLTNQVRGIARVVTAVANGDLKKKLTVEAKGEVAELADTINSMIETLATFAEQVTSVAREVGVEGRLGGQANVPGAAGTWHDLTDNVNRMAASLTTQVRAITEVAAAVAMGDLTRSIAVDAAGEVAVLKDNVNSMIHNLIESTRQNNEQDWLKTNLAKFTRLLQGQRDLLTVTKSVLSELAPLVSIQHGVVYLTDFTDEEPLLKFFASYGYQDRGRIAKEFRPGESLVGQCYLEKQRILITDVPNDYVKINSGLGEALPLNIMLMPVLFEEQVLAVIELASFQHFSSIHQTFLDQLTESIGIVLNTIQANMRTEDLLKQSQLLAKELQNQQEELQETNEELADKAKLLAEQNQEVEKKNIEVELAKQSVEEKAKQLTLTSKYKSEFLANMSHELRTPLNNLMILSQQLSENEDGNLKAQQVEAAKIINASGGDLLALINDILDLSKIESGIVTLDPSEFSVAEIHDYIERTFRPVAQEKNLNFRIEKSKHLPRTLWTDNKRFSQILKNTLSNAFKFTEKGDVVLRIDTVQEGWNRNIKTLNMADYVLSFAVSDTGIGIAVEKQALIFEAFQQADGTTSRKYGGTGLGLSISREIAHLLGGDIRVDSKPGQGSSFTLYLPQSYKSISPNNSCQDNDSQFLEDKSSSYNGERRSKTEAIQTLALIPDLRAAFDDEQLLLIITDDRTFADILAQMAQTSGFRTHIITRGDEALDKVRKLLPNAITLDISLPGMNGWEILQQLKNDSSIAHIPTHVFSFLQEQDQDLGLQMSALEKPISVETIQTELAQTKDMLGKKNVLVVGSDVEDCSVIMGVFAVETTTVTARADEALTILGSKPIELVILDLELPDMAGFRIIEALKRDERFDIPVIVYAGREPSKGEKKYPCTVVKAVLLKDGANHKFIFGRFNSFLRSVQDDLDTCAISEDRISDDSILKNKQVLIVDDDIRNIFALSSVLERQGMNVISAENGKQGIEVLLSTPSVDIVLMDIMMPEMDGFEAMRIIRNMEKFKDLPVFALTAKAMKGDREKCLECGANEHVTKPIDTEQLLGLLRSWLSATFNNPMKEHSKGLVKNDG